MTTPGPAAHAGRAVRLGRVVFAALAILASAACSGPGSAGTPDPAAGAPEPAAGVRVGDLVWAERNLDVRRYRNGDPIVQARTREELLDLGGRGVGAWMYVNEDPSTVAAFGLFYNWYAVMDPRGIGPEGWRLPTDDDWQRLARHFGEDTVGTALKSPHGWVDDGGGTDSSGFGAVPAGFRGWDETVGHGRFGSWWTATELEDVYFAWMRGVGSDYSDLYRNRSTKYWGMSVRLVRPGDGH